MAAVQPVVRKETRNVALITLVGVLLMCVVFFILHLFLPESVPFDYRVILGGVCAGAVAVLNFFLMGLDVQKIALLTEEDEARKAMQKSYYKRFGLQVLWIVAAIAAPCFHIVAGLLPLMFPGLGIRLRGVIAHMFPMLAPKVGIGDDVSAESELTPKAGIGDDTPADS